MWQSLTFIRENKKKLQITRAAYERFETYCARKIILYKYEILYILESSELITKFFVILNNNLRYIKTCF